LGVLSLFVSFFSLLLSALFNMEFARGFIIIHLLKNTRTA
jgi:hypothetical protein